jgi:ribosomal protein S6
MFIVRPDVTEEDLDKLVTTLQGHATTAGAVVKSVDKFITVRTDEEQQRLEKVRKLRASRTKRPSAEASQAENEQPAVNA